MRILIYLSVIVGSQFLGSVSFAIGRQIPRLPWASMFGVRNVPLRCQVLLNSGEVPIATDRYETETLKFVAGRGIESNWRGLVVKFETGGFKLAQNVADNGFVHPTHYQEAKDSVAAQADRINDLLLENSENLKGFGVPVFYSAAIFNGVGYFAMFMSAENSGRLQGSISSDKIGGFTLNGPEKQISGVFLFQITDEIRLMRAYNVQWPEAPNFLLGSLNPLAQQSLQALINSDAMTFAILRAGIQL